MKKTVTIISSIVLLVSGITFSANERPVYANINDEIQEVREKKEDVLNDQEALQDEIDALESKEAALEAEIERLDNQVSETTNQIIAKQEELRKLKEDIEKLEAEVVETQKRIDERDKLLKERVKAMYVNGGSVSYLEVLLGSKSFGDFLDRVLALSTIAEQDKAILDEQIADKAKLDQQVTELETKQTEAEERVEELQAMQQQLEDSMEEKTTMMAEVQEQSEELHSEMHELEDEAGLLAAQERAFIQEKKRQEEEAARRRAAAEAGQAPSVSAPSGGSGMLLKPANASLTSGYGQRWGRLHAGVDLARGGSVPVVAAADGTVIRSYYSNSYGNVVFITHYLNGQQWTTVYAHMRNRQVGTGERVSRGQQLGLMGSTGDSTGQHLHFELHRGPWNGAKSNSVNPLPYFN